MRFDLKGVVAVSAIPLLGGALAVGTTTPAASAQTWRDTAVTAFRVVQPSTSTTTGAVINAVAGGGGRLSFTAPIGEAFAASPTLTRTAGFDATLTTGNVHRLVLTAGGFGSGGARLAFTIKSMTGATCTATETVRITETDGVGPHLTKPTHDQCPEYLKAKLRHSCTKRTTHDPKVASTALEGATPTLHAPALAGCWPSRPW